MCGLLRRAAMGVDHRMGERVYGERNRFTCMAAARFGLWRARRAYPNGAERDGLPAKALSMLGQPYGESWLDALHDAMEEGLASNAVETVTSGDTVLQEKVSSMDYDFSEHVELEGAFPDTVREHIQSYFGSYFQVDEMRAYRTHPVPDNVSLRASTLNWHVDQAPPTQIKLFILLTAVGPDDGPTEYLDAPTGSFSRHDANIVNRSEVAADDYIQITGQRGTAYLFAPANVLHRAGHPENTVRDIVYFRLYPSREPLSENWTETAPYASDSSPSRTATGHLLNV